MSNVMLNILVVDKQDVLYVPCDKHFEVHKVMSIIMLKQAYGSLSLKMVNMVKL